MKKLYLVNVAQRLDAVLAEASRAELTYLCFLDQVLPDELAAKQRKRIHMGIQVAPFPIVKALEEFDFKFQPSIDRRLVRELGTGRLIAQAENVVEFGPPGVGRRIWRWASVGPRSSPGHKVLFTSATGLPAALARTETDGNIDKRLGFSARPKILVIDELGYLPFELRSAHLFFQLVAKRYEKSTMLITTNQPITQWGTIFGDEVLAAAILERLPHRSQTILIKGESYRLRQKREAGFFGGTGTTTATRSTLASEGGQF
jgi:DNA replication protein DnaC